MLEQTTTQNVNENTPCTRRLKLRRPQVPTDCRTPNGHNVIDVSQSSMVWHLHKLGKKLFSGRTQTDHALGAISNKL